MIDGELYRSMILAAATAVEERMEEVNALNVFPVPDGDTGTNMSLTLNNAATELGKLQNPTLARALEVTSSALLRGARGNSGVILSLIFRGIAKSMKDLKVADGKHLAAAIAEGADTAYGAVMKPTEGTILTVCRVCGDAANKAARKNKDPEYVMTAVMEAGKKALDETTGQNPVLARAGVVDAGGFGLLLIFSGMQLALSGKMTQLAARFMPTSMSQMDLGGADFSQFDAEEITFAYCTEFIADRENKRKSVKRFKGFLESIGDSIVVVEDDDIVKVHVHTDTPDKALHEALQFGMLSAIKIENMVEQAARQSRSSREKNMGKRTIAPAQKTFGFVSVAAGEGVSEVFRDLGVDILVEGGQTMNPSTEDVLRAIDATPAEVVFVLPNNKNIIMASQQAAALSEKQVVVLETKTIPQGICALMSFDPDAGKEANQSAMETAMAGVRSGQVTYAARDSEFDGKKINQGDYLALEESRLLATDRRLEDVVRRLAKSMCKTECGFITILYGEGADQAQAARVQQIFEDEAKGAEINVIFGGQPVYSYIISVE